MPQIESSVNRTDPNGYNHDDIPIIVHYTFDNGEPLVIVAEVGEDIPFMFPNGKPMPAPYFLTKENPIGLTIQEISRLEEKIATDEIGSHHDDAYERYKDKYQ